MNIKTLQEEQLVLHRRLDELSQLLEHFRNDYLGMESVVITANEKAERAWAECRDNAVSMGSATKRIDNSIADLNTRIDRLESR